MRAVGRTEVIKVACIANGKEGGRDSKCRETSYAVMSRREKVVVNWKWRVCRKFL